MDEQQPEFPLDYKIEEEAYSSVLKDSAEVSMDLPKWKTTSDRWAELAEQWRQFIKSIYDKYLKPETDLKADWIDWNLISTILIGLFWFSVIVLVIYIIITLVQRFSEPRQFKIKESWSHISSREEKLVDLVKKAMNEGNWALASKLRWRLFLERTNRSAEITPLEFESQKKPALPRAIEQYENMFTEPGSSQEWYVQYSEKLKKLEGPQ